MVRRNSSSKKSKASGVIWLVALLCIVCLLYEPLARRAGVDTEKEGITALLDKLSERAARDTLPGSGAVAQDASSPVVGTETGSPLAAALSGDRKTSVTKASSSSSSTASAAPAAKTVIPLAGRCVPCAVSALCGSRAAGPPVRCLNSHLQKPMKI